MTPPVGGLLLDLDGTLVLSERVHRLTWQRVFDDHGVHVDEEQYRARYLGRRAVDVLTQEPGPWRADHVPAIVEGMVAHGLTLDDAVDVVPGAAALVEAAVGAGVPVAVVTSAGARWAGHVLDTVLGVRDLVGVLVTAEQVDLGKPAPEGYLRACRELGVDPGACLGVEDSPSGLTALDGAGVGHRIGITTTAAAGALRACGAHGTVPDLHAVRPLVVGR